MTGPSMWVRRLVSSVAALDDTCTPIVPARMPLAGPGPLGRARGARARSPLIPPHLGHDPAAPRTRDAVGWSGEARQNGSMALKFVQLGLGGWGRSWGRKSYARFRT